MVFCLFANENSATGYGHDNTACTNTQTHLYQADHARKHATNHEGNLSVEPDTKHTYIGINTPHANEGVVWRGSVHTREGRMEGAYNREKENKVRERDGRNRGREKYVGYTRGGRGLEIPAVFGASVSN